MKTNNNPFDRQSLALTAVKAYRRLFCTLSSIVLMTLVLPGGAEELQPLDCVINPSEVADLGTAVPGLLKTVRVDRSDFVRAGDIVAELESGVEQAAVDLARARAELRAEVDLRRVNAAFGRRQQERSKGLFQRKALSTNDMDQRETEAKTAQYQLRQALDNQRLAKLELHRAEEILRRRTIKSPFTGVVMDRFKTVGEYVEDQPVVRMAQLDPLHVEVIVPVEMLGDIKPGMVADVWSEAIKGTWQARVSQVDRVADAASGTYVARLTLPNADYRIPAGLHCRMRFVEAAEQPPVLGQPPGQRDLRLSSLPPQPEQNEAVAEHPASVDEASNGAHAVVVEDEDAAHRERVLKEVPGEPDASVSSDSEKPGLPECLWAGPFANEDDANVRVKQLREAGLHVEVERQTMPVSVGYQVISQTMAKRAQAKRLLSALQAAGVSDLFLQKTKDRKWRISLGLYSKKYSAKKRAADLGNKGFEASLVPWKKKMPQFFLVVQGADQTDASDLLSGLPVPDANTSPAEPGCPRLAGR